MPPGLSIRDPVFLAAGSTPPTSGLELWFDSSTITGLNDGDPVSTWNDMSGNGRNATQSGEARPTYKINIVNGKPVVRFAASSYMTHTYSRNAQAPFSIFSVIKQTVDAYDYMTVIICQAASQPVVHFASRAGGINGLDTYLNNHIQSSLSIGNNWGVTSLVVTSADASNGVLFAANGSSETKTGNGSFSFGSARQTLGSNTPTSDGFQGDMAEILVYSTAVSSSERTQIENYLNNKYKIY